MKCAGGGNGGGLGPSLGPAEDAMALQEKGTGGGGSCRGRAAGSNLKMEDVEMNTCIGNGPETKQIISMHSLTLPSTKK